MNHKWMRTLLQTGDGLGLSMLRWILGIVFFAHGAQKMLGWFGGAGFTEYLHYLIYSRHIPPVFSFLAIIAEFFGALGLLAGLCSRVAAFGIMTNMWVAIFLVHARFGFFMNWNTNKPGEGYEFHLLAIVMTLVIMVEGAGRLSLDRWLYRRGEAEETRISTRSAETPKACVAA